MRRILSLLSAVLLLTGCASNNDLFDGVLTLRDKLLKCNGCVFDAEIIADYGDRYYTFSMKCQADQNGAVSFRVTEPETIAGICGTLSESGGGLTFDDKVLAFEMMADGLITPVSAPWLMLKALRSGYLHACSEYENGTYLQINDSYMEGELQVDVWLKENSIPEVCELYWKGSRFLTVRVSNFEIM